IVLCVVALAVFLVVLLRRDEAPQTQEEIAASAPAPAPAASHDLPDLTNDQAALRQARNGTQAGTSARPEDKPAFRPWHETLRQALTEPDNASIRSLIENAREKHIGGERTALLEDVARSLMAADPSRAALLLGQIEDLRDRHFLASAMTRALFEKDPQTAAQWAARIPASTLAQDRCP
ncbi:MAG: hypothetical protein AAB676_08400, partial [Verrucomicrobiota bacterium]